MNNHPLIGCYVPRNQPLPVYYDPDSQEIYYLDEQGGAYLLTGLELDTANPIDLKPNIMAKEINKGYQGIIHGGSYYWLLSKTYMQASKRPRLLGRLADHWEALGWAAYTDNVEYKPKKC